MWNIYENHSRAAAPKTDGGEDICRRVDRLVSADVHLR